MHPGALGFSAAMSPSSKTARQVPKKRKAPVRRRKTTVRGLPASKLLEDVPADARALAEAITADGGLPLAVYRDPLGGHGVVFAALPIDKVQPTPYQRDLSEPHLRRLASAMTRVDRFLDPLIAVRQDGQYWTPNGNHRLGATRFLGAQSVVALVLPEPELAFQILALNTEKAHNLKERSLEVIRMLRGLVAVRKGTELDVAPLLEEPAFATLGAAYEKRPRLSGGAYQSIVKRVDGFLDEPLTEALAIREERADAVLKLDDAVSAVVERLKAKGLTSPYLKAFVVARINYLRFVKTAPEFDAALEKLTRAAERFSVEKVRQEDVKASGPPDASDEG
jgi:ParB family transcriptional regulator, chromosome partitioning protein